MDRYTVPERKGRKYSGVEINEQVALVMKLHKTKALCFENFKENPSMDNAFHFAVAYKRWDEEYKKYGEMQR